MSQVLLNKLVDDILDGNSVEAKQTFEDAIAVKLTDALNQRKMDIAQQIYSPSDEITDVEIDNEVSEFENEETTEDNNG